MMRPRTIKPYCWQAESVGSLSTSARLLWLVLITMADDEGRVANDVDAIRSHGYPSDKLPPRKIRAWLGEIQDAGLIVVEGNRLLFPNWNEHQRIPNKEMVRMHRSMRRARKRNAPVVEQIQRDYIYQRDMGICGLCHGFASPNNWHMDHVVPLAGGGEHSHPNVQVAHPSCNMRKGAR